MQTIVASTGTVGGGEVYRVVGMPFLTAMAVAVPPFSPQGNGRFDKNGNLE
jgi:hypothetical protein